MRKITATAGLLLTLSLCLLLSAFTTDAPLYTGVCVNGTDADPEKLAFAEDGSVWVSLRHVSEALGAAEITWEGGSQTACVKAEGLELTAAANAPYIIANGRYLYIENGCQTVDGRVMVPVKTLCTAFGADAQWDGESSSVIITSGSSPITSGDKFYSKTDLYWLSRIIHAEARGESFEGQIAVGSVVMNRVASEEFPDTVKSVIFDRRSGIQFSPAYSGSIYNTPYQSCVIAAKLALEGVSNVGDSLYFSLAKTASSSWAGRNCQYVGQIGNHVFYA